MVRERNGRVRIYYKRNGRVVRERNGRSGRTFDEGHLHEDVKEGRKEATYMFWGRAFQERVREFPCSRLEQLARGRMAGNGIVGVLDVRPQR